MSTLSDQHYIDKIIQGETAAFAVLVDRYKDMIFTFGNVVGDLVGARIVDQTEEWRVDDTVGETQVIIT